MSAAALALAAATLGGVTAGAAGVLATGGDPTDGWFLYLVAVPAGAVAAFLLARFVRVRGWSCGLAWGLGLWLGGAVALGGPGNLWPISLAFHLVLALPAVAGGALGGWLRRRA